MPEESNMMEKMQELLSDPESMQQISELARMLQGEPEASGDAPEHSAPSSLPGLDPSALLQMSSLLRDSPPDRNAALLLALRPHLGERRQNKLDRAVRMLRLWNLFQTAQKSGMLQNLLS